MALWLTYTNTNIQHDVGTLPIYPKIMGHLHYRVGGGISKIFFNYFSKVGDSYNLYSSDNACTCNIPILTIRKLITIRLEN